MDGERWPARLLRGLRTGALRCALGRGEVIHQGDALTVLRMLPDESAQMCVTSPPYWGLRSYGTDPLVFGGDPVHVHEWGEAVIANAASYKEGSKVRWNHRENGRGEEQAHMLDRAGWERKRVQQGNFCPCGAWRGDLGLEPTPELFVAHMVEIFREVRRVLKPDGVLWLNLGDSYAATSKGSGGKTNSTLNAKRDANGDLADDRKSQPWMAQPRRFSLDDCGIKPKDLIGIPWRVAFALQEAGWYLRCDIIWSKPNPMPESVTDRPTKAHEYIFLLSKSERYYYDADAIAERAVVGAKRFNGGHDVGADRNDNRRSDPTGIESRNKRSVWSIATRPFPEAHFATFPEEIPTLCILAGSRPGDVVLDPFNGAGTTGVVCEKLGRSYVGIELNPAYVEMAERRIRNVAPLFNQVSE